MSDLAQRYRAIVEETLRIEREEAIRKRSNDEMNSESKPRPPAFVGPPGFAAKADGRIC
jgi:hypothetical protein